MAYGLDVCGDDYHGFGEDEQREVNMELMSASKEMFEALVEALEFQESMRGLDHVSVKRMKLALIKTGQWKE